MCGLGFISFLDFLFCFVITLCVRPQSSFVWKSPVAEPLLAPRDVDKHNDLGDFTRHWTRCTDVSFAQAALPAASVNMVGSLALAASRDTDKGQEMGMRGVLEWHSDA